jgi:plasmid stabilization system protein ParE
MTRLVVAVDAGADTGAILEYIEKQAGSRVASEFGVRFRRTIERLVALPFSGAPRPSLGANARIAVVFPYVLIYDYMQEDDTPTLLRILHGNGTSRAISCGADPASAVSCRRG